MPGEAIYSTGHINQIFSIVAFLKKTKTENFDGRPSFWQIVIHTPVQLVAGVSN